MFQGWHLLLDVLLKVIKVTPTQSICGGTPNALEPLMIFTLQETWSRTDSSWSPARTADLRDVRVFTRSRNQIESPLTHIYLSKWGQGHQTVPYEWSFWRFRLQVNTCTWMKVKRCRLIISQASFWSNNDPLVNLISAGGSLTGSDLLVLITSRDGRPQVKGHSSCCLWSGRQ